MVFEALSRPTENRCDALHAHALRGDWTVFEALKISSLHFELGVTVEFLDANLFFHSGLSHQILTSRVAP